MLLIKNLGLQSRIFLFIHHLPVIVQKTSERIQTVLVTLTNFQERADRYILNIRFSSIYYSGTSHDTYI